jgi:hypothetical protein
LKYFPAWLSGFIEAEGCFRIKPKSLYIGQNDDYNILNSIKKYFHSSHSIGINKDIRYKKIQYRISFSGKRVLQNIQLHFQKNPLLGNKKCAFNKWCREVTSL